jgi:hypothetical protein
MAKDKSEKKKKAAVQVQGDIEMVDAPEVSYRGSLLPFTLQIFPRARRKVLRREARSLFRLKIYLLLPILLPRKNCTRSCTRPSKKVGQKLLYTLSIITEGWLASKSRQVKRGVKEVAKGIRKGEKGSVHSCRCLSSLDVSKLVHQASGPRCRYYAH